MKVKIDHEENRKKVQSGLRILARIIARKIIDDDLVKSGEKPEMAKTAKSRKRKTG